ARSFSRPRGGAARAPAWPAPSAGIDSRCRVSMVIALRSGKRDVSPVGEPAGRKAFDILLEYYQSGNRTTVEIPIEAVNDPTRRGKLEWDLGPAPWPGSSWIRSPTRSRRSPN